MKVVKGEETELVFDFFFDSFYRISRLYVLKEPHLSLRTVWTKNNFRKSFRIETRVSSHFSAVKMRNLMALSLLGLVVLLSFGPCPTTGQDPQPAGPETPPGQANPGDSTGDAKPEAGAGPGADAGQPGDGAKPANDGTAAGGNGTQSVADEPCGAPQSLGPKWGAVTVLGLAIIPLVFRQCQV